MFSEYKINKRSYIQDEGAIEPDKNYLFDLAYLSSLSVKGERAAEFLQGQLSCDLSKVCATTIQQGVMCNLQGRVLAIFDLIDWQGFKMILPKDMLRKTMASLQQTALLSRVQLEQESSYQIYGLYLTNLNDLLPANIQLPSAPFSLAGQENVCCYSQSKSFYLLFIRPEDAPALREPFMAKKQLRASLAWHRLKLMHNAIEIYPDTRGIFLPHRLDLHLSGHLCFDKGCYKGQEIIARTHYRAKLKHGLRCFMIETEEPLHAGKKLFDLTGKNEIGELIDYCPLGSKRFLAAFTILNEHPDCGILESHSTALKLEPFDNYCIHH